jgi:hypothetical protein
MPEKLPPPGSGGTAKQPRTDRAQRAADPVVLPLGPAGRRPPVSRRPPGRRRPLPDAVAVRQLIVPDSAPPFDDELPAAGAVTGGVGAAKVTRAEVAAAEAAATAAALPDTASADVAASRTEDRWPGQFAQVLAETLAGTRPPRQITPWTTEHARRRIRQLGPLLADSQQPRLRRVITSRPAADVVEMTVVVKFGPRVRALAVRLERDGPQRNEPQRDQPQRHGPQPPGQEPQARSSRWLCTAVEAA